MWYTQHGHIDYQDTLKVLDSDHELILLNGDPTDYYMFEVVNDINNCKGKII